MSEQPKYRLNGDDDRIIEQLSSDGEWMWMASYRHSDTARWRVEALNARDTIAELQGQLDAARANERKPMRVVTQPDFVIDWGEDDDAGSEGTVQDGIR